MPVFVGDDGGGLVRRQAFQQRKPKQQVIARPADQPERRPLHHRSVHFIDDQDVMEARTVHFPAHVVQRLEQHGRFGARDLTALRGRQPDEQCGHRRLQREPERDRQQEKQLPKLEQQDQGAAAGKSQHGRDPAERDEAEADSRKHQGQDAKAQQGEQRHLCPVALRRMRALLLQARHHALETVHFHCHRLPRVPGSGVNQKQTSLPNFADRASIWNAIPDAH
jgi:hypothetical protein